ncbi:Nem1-Spo7 phosphatase complex catalytic subunit Nem1 [Schizosaccharomyces pombe]|uniref:Nuclear envelope morphology protein 1 n=1 Tax=Schizosaccharomyces pombe (strain 972 / ATCC 24843) TaxID=284812 RepID=NEM1_SCHPO|nr:putative Nem1-Spo7 phosphatase complex catalytic subunit Nem1 [Schizosaccharomyces pombe]O59718.1 RecName: Full=Nuclear envelope morphology protein 1 [Schizosaccharomyces pombe 972h-]CAA18299.1 Nem1-Spo7 phosphatase complex catalytic subunit Nem1 (predicted) [Schizosaccharomyces pombe]|eukprot:NP_596404.1 putative Nem1-Spo7 phosphatase complex catalytic subunit Nem1 [Schizosaccharomyces pombe]
MNSIARLSDEINKAILATPLDDDEADKEKLANARGRASSATLRHYNRRRSSYSASSLSSLSSKPTEKEVPTRNEKPKHANIMRVVVYWIRVFLKRIYTFFVHSARVFLYHFLNEEKEFTLASFFWGLCRFVFFPVLLSYKRREMLPPQPSVRRPRFYSSYSYPSSHQDPAYSSFKRHRSSNSYSSSSNGNHVRFQPSIAEEEISFNSFSNSLNSEEDVCVSPMKPKEVSLMGKANSNRSGHSHQPQSTQFSPPANDNISKLPSSFTIVNDPLKSPSSSRLRIRNITLCADKIPRPLLNSKLPRKTLVLDLDETLIHSVSRGSRTTSGQPIEVHVPGEHPILYYIHKRPHLDYFLSNVSQWFRLILFTASVQPYADPIIDYLERDKKIFAKRYYRQHCALVDSSFVKDISICNIHLSRIMIIDNSPASYNAHKENAIPIEGWISDPSDVDLLNLLSFLHALQYVHDVRDLLGLRLAK